MLVSGRVRDTSACAAAHFTSSAVRAKWAAHRPQIFATARTTYTGSSSVQCAALTTYIFSIEVPPIRAILKKAKNTSTPRYHGIPHAIGTHILDGRPKVPLGRQTRPHACITVRSCSPPKNELFPLKHDLSQKHLALRHFEKKKTLFGPSRGRARWPNRRRNTNFISHFRHK